jgi:hypothetical protein
MMDPCNRSSSICLGDATKRAVEFYVSNDSVPQVHSTCTLKQFVDSAHDPGVCGNLLDMKAMSAPIPGLIS